MSVYVDASIWPLRAYGGRRMMMCHMIADTLEELHKMADRIGMQRKWFQDKSVPHYDICKSKRAQAVKLGAIECDRRTYVGHMRRIRGDK